MKTDPFLWFSPSTPDRDEHKEQTNKTDVSYCDIFLQMYITTPLEPVVVYYDFETTGLKPEYDDPIEIGAVTLIKNMRHSYYR